MASFTRNLLGSSVFVLGVLAVGCFNPDPPMLTTDGSSSGDSGSDTGMPDCSPGQTQDCTCPDGSTGTQACAADGSGFGACECSGVDTGSTTDPDPTTGEPPECEIAQDCPDTARGDCEQTQCNDGQCVVEPVAEGTPCGDATETECSAADTCDGEGSCLANDAIDGTPCTDCALGFCVCTAAACGDCTFAPTNNFVTDRSIEGWELTGGWQLYRQAPQNQQSGPVTFSGQVFGTDGNRSAPYPGAELETSYARTAPMVLPATLELLSWHVDEGSIPYDTKTINVSTDGGMSFQPVVDCMVDPSLPFCQPRSDPRDPDDWDMISIPLPPGVAGQVGIIEFTYDTMDQCCSFERGWFLDALNFATECACTADESCAPLGGDCGAGVCGASGECELDAVAADTACGDATDVECNAPDTCDGLGYCQPNEAVTGLTACSDCPGGPGACHVCQAGACPDCIGLPALNDFSFGTQSIAGWLIEDLSGTGADWQIYFEAPPNTNVGSVPVPLSFAPSFGTDGNRQQPYGPMSNELEHSRVTTPPDVVPPMITFDSWHVDEGMIDDKIIEISVDGGVTWNELVHCNGNPMGQPFCNFVGDGRAGDAWDSISLDTAAYAGMVGQLRITYDTQDGCCDFERGWFLDNLAFAQYCTDPQFPL